VYLPDIHTFPASTIRSNCKDQWFFTIAAHDVCGGHLKNRKFFRGAPEYNYTPKQPEL
jgi:hypothetical protein